ncbi:hypothetical protein llap_19066 [Limosa lapponica baueri]|uniref:RING-type E3 ubiquitin transferase n=1 Tax=Limosa lapponica baueri TaxID=1758121 RepID=A0A2I0TA02_LIMLA|nr:hypothetical protein llap_19066 [Limosa lapponica baueri]
MASTSQLQQAGWWEAAADSPCPNCLGNVDDTVYINAYCHHFCFGCIQQWAATRAARLLSRQPFNCVLHTVRADDDYQEHMGQLVHSPSEDHDQGEDAQQIPTVALQPVPKAHQRLACSWVKGACGEGLRGCGMT